MKNKLGLAFLTSLLAIPVLTACEPEIRYVYVSKWGDEYAEDIVKNLGVDIPYWEHKTVDVELSFDDLNEPMLSLFLTFDDTTTIDAEMDGYAQYLASRKGYTVVHRDEMYIDYDTFTVYQYSVYYADRVIDEENNIGLELQFLEGNHNGKECMGIYAFTYLVVDQTKWPTDFLMHYLGVEVPHPEWNYIDGYYFDAYVDVFEKEKEDDPTIPYVIISVGGTYLDDEEEYKDYLIEQGFGVSDAYYDDGEGYYAFYTLEEDEDADTSVALVINFFYSYDYGCLIIYVFVN